MKVALFALKVIYFQIFVIGFQFFAEVRPTCMQKL